MLFGRIGEQFVRGFWVKFEGGNCVCCYIVCLYIKELTVSDHFYPEQQVE
jgi:hypothetical protein